MRWFDEFKAEIIHDHTEIVEKARRTPPGDPWSFEHAVARTRQFYRERVGGFASCRSVEPAEREALLALVESLGTDSFPF